VKDKESAKRNLRKDSFDNTFDKIMQLANYNETNGIVVGPEISRIFAEVILQQIDLNVLNQLEINGLKFGLDYEIRRYIDDYFVFSNDENHLKIILKIFKWALEEYKLYVNDAKTEIRTTPFITNIAVGKRELKHLLDDLFTSLIIHEDVASDEEKIEKKISIKKLKTTYSVSQYFIKDFQCIVRRNNLSYDILSKDIVRYTKRMIEKIFSKQEIEKTKEVIENFLLLVLDISFYAYSLNITSSTTFKLAQMIVLICKFLEGKDEDLRHSIFSKIFREADFVITIFQRKSKQNETNVETLNLLISLKKLDETYLISEEKIKNLFGLKQSSNFQKLNYFHIVTLLYYIGNNAAYNNLRSDIEKLVVSRFATDKDPFTKSELTLLFFDFINCPFVSLDSKKKIMLESRFAKCGKEEAEINEITKQKIWFMDWDTDIDLERVLKKKEWGASY
jgi:hypothetical protein